MFLIDFRYNLITKYPDVQYWFHFSYIMRGVHEKLFPVVCAANQMSDNKLIEKIKLLSGVTAEQLGVREEFCCPLPAAVRTMEIICYLL